jgi:hypothetical protein
MKKHALMGCILGLVAATTTACSSRDRDTSADLDRALERMTGLVAPAAFCVSPAGPIAYEATVALALFPPRSLSSRPRRSSQGAGPRTSNACRPEPEGPR